MGSIIRWFIVSALLLASSALVYGQGGNFVRQVVSGTVANGGSGQVIPNAIITVCPSTSTGNPCSPLSPNVYSDPALSQSLGNPFSADTNGFYSIFLPTGDYLLQESTPVGAGFTYSESFLVYVNGTGTVSSVGLSMPSIFTVSGSPITSSGVISVGLSAAAPDTVFGNCSGSSTTPSFCSLIANQIPSTLNATGFSGGITVTGNSSITGSLTVTGNETLLGTNLNMTGGILSAQGVQAGSSGLAVTGTSSLAGLNVSGSAALSGGGSLAGNFSGGPVFTGLPIFDGANFVNGFQLNGSYGTNGYCVVSTGSSTVFSPGCGLGGTPTISVGAGAGSGAGFSLTSGSTDKVGNIQLITGSSPCAGNCNIVQVTFSTPFTSFAFCTFSNSNPSDVNPPPVLGISSSLSSFQIETYDVALSASTGYQWSYSCNGH